MFHCKTIFSGITITAMLLVSVYFHEDVFALNAPYLISAQAIDDHRISLSWRNNDVTAEKNVILRKTTSTVWNKIDSLPATTAVYIDDFLSPSTEYFYALLATASGQSSDTSNVLSARTLQKLYKFNIPAIKVVRIETNKSIDINFLDSCNFGKKFRLYRNSLNSAWAAIDSQYNCSPDSMVWRLFNDKTPIPNTWYSYKVQAFNDSLSVFSPETTIYNYTQPDNNEKYSISLLSSIPANPVTWIEKLGDSLFFPERLPQGDTQIAIIDISKPQSPQFKSYFKPGEIPDKLKKSIVDARINLRPRNHFFDHISGYYVILKNNVLYQYDSITQSLRDSIKFNYGTSTGWFIGTLNDSCFLLGFNTLDLSLVYPVRLGLGGIDTFSCSIKWQTGGATGQDWGGGSLGCFNKKAVIITWIGGGMIGYNYSYKLYDFSVDYSKPLLFNLTDTIRRFSWSNSNMVFNRNVTLNCRQLSNGLALYAIDISNAYSGFDNYLGRLIDTTFKSTSILSTIVDTNKNMFIVMGDKAISLYSYSKSVVGIDSPFVSVNRTSGTIKMIQSLNCIYFCNSASNQVSLEIFNVNGRFIRKIVSSSAKNLLWDKKDFYGKRVCSGLYVFRIKGKNNEYFSGSLIIYN